jgi:hypothetical protein
VERDSQPDLERIRRLASELGATDPGPAGALAAELAEALAGLSARIDALWELISAIVASAGLGGTAETTPTDLAQADFAQAVARARKTGQRGVRLSIDGREWVVALSQPTLGQPTLGQPTLGHQPPGQQPPGAGQAAWAAIERLARESSDQDDR